MPALLLADAADTSDAADAAELPAASYSRTLSEAELEGWLRFVPNAATQDRRLDLQNLALTQYLASEAVWLGLDRQVEVQLELELRQAVLAEEAMRRAVAASVSLTEEEIEAKYEAIKDTFTHPRRVRLRNLFKRFPPQADDAARAVVRAEMEELRRRIVAGQDFATLAAEHSDSQTRFQGGLIGNVPAGTLAPEVDAIAMAMQPGEVSRVLSGADGLTLLYCEKILPKVERSAEELRDIARLRLKNQTSRRTWEASRTRWLEGAKIVYHWPVIESEVSSDDAVAVTFDGGALSRRQLTALMAAPRPVSQLPQGRIRQRVEFFTVAKAAQREAVRRGLEHFPDLAQQQLWTQRRILAETTSFHWVKQRFEAPSEAEVRRYFEAHRESFVRPKHFDLAAILLPAVSDLQADFRRAEDLVYRLQSGELGFEEAVRRHSRHASAQNGGRLGWISRQALPHVYGLKVLRAVLAMQPGQLSGVVQDDDKLWIFKLLASEEERSMTWQEARAEAEDRLGSERVAEVEAQLRQELVERLNLRWTPKPSPNGS